jgi:hypothetical protein
MTDKEKKGIDLTVKSLRKQYPFVKGWYMVDDSYTYVFHINLLVDPIEAINFIADKYDVEIYPSNLLLNYIIKRNPEGYDATVLMLYTSIEGEGGEMVNSSDSVWDSLFEITYKLKEEMNNRLSDGYSLLPDDYKIETIKDYKIPMIHRYRITPEKD